MATLHDYRLILALCLLCPICGCRGNNRAAVEGSVSLDGQPLESGTIAFLPIEGTHGPSSGGSIAEGHYSVPADKGPVTGVYRVEINAQRATGKMIMVPAGVNGLVETQETKERIHPLTTRHRLCASKCIRARTPAISLCFRSQSESSHSGEV